GSCSRWAETERDNLRDKSVAIAGRPVAMIDMTALGVPAAEHDAVIIRALERQIVDGPVALAYDGQKETFPSPAGRWHLDDIAVVLVEAMRAYRDVARARHDLLDAEVIVAADQRHGGQHKPLRGVRCGQCAQGEVWVLESRHAQNVMSERVMPAFLVAAQRWHGRTCIHDPPALRCVCCSIHRDHKLAYHPAELRALARQERTHVLGLARLHALGGEGGAH